MEHLRKQYADKTNHLLRPHNSLRNINSPRTVLVVATEGCLSIPNDLEAFTEGKNGVNVHVTKSLPLPNGDRHPPVDVVAFVYEAHNKESFDTIKRSLPYVDLRYFVGKCFILSFSDVHNCPDDGKDIEELAAAFQIPMHYVSRQKDPTKPESLPSLKLPPQLLSTYCPPPGDNVNSLTVQCALHYGERLVKGS